MEFWIRTEWEEEEIIHQEGREATDEVNSVALTTSELLVLAFALGLLESLAKFTKTNLWLISS